MSTAGVSEGEIVENREQKTDVARLSVNESSRVSGSSTQLVSRASRGRGRVRVKPIRVEF